MRILTMLTILSFCGSIFAQNSAIESAFGNNYENVLVTQNDHRAKNQACKTVANSAGGDQAIALVALPLELANSISIKEFVASLKSPLISNSHLVAHQDIDVARAMAVYSPEMAREMMGVMPTKKSSNHQLAKSEENSNS